MIDEAAYIYPADLSKAKKHRLATRIFKGSLKQIQQGERCECCHRHVGVEDNDAPVGCDYKPAERLSFLGPGVPLLFYFTQNAGYFLFTFFCMFCIYAMYSNYKGNSCECDDSYSNRITRFSIINKLGDNKQLNIQSALCAIFIVCYFFFNQWLVLRIRRKNVKCDQIINSPSDYSLLITHLPSDTTEQEIRQVITEFKANLSEQQIQRTNNLCIEKVLLSYGLKQFLKLNHHRYKKYIKLKKKQPNTQIPTGIIKADLKTASFAIVIFQYKLSKQLFLENRNTHKLFGKGIFHSCFYPSVELSIRGKTLSLSRAPEPDDIIWQNADIKRSKMVLHTCLSYGIGIALLFGGGYLQYFLQVTQNSITNSTQKQIFSYANSVGVSLVNAIILQFLRIVTKIEGQKTRTTQNRSLLVKISLYSFFNCGVFYSAAYVLAISLQKFTLDGYFAYQVVHFMAINAIVPNLINLVFNKLQIPNWIIRKITKNRPMTQRSANQLYELTQPDFSMQYGYVIQTIWLTCFYSPFVPVVGLLSLSGLVWFYYTEAQLFRKSYKVPNMLSFDLTMMACRLSDYSALFLSLGHLLIILYLKFTIQAEITTIQISSLSVSFFFSLLLIAVPSFKLNRSLYQLPHKYDDQKQYSQCLNDFEVTYEETNPLFDASTKRRKHLIHYFNFQKQAQKDKELQQNTEMETKRITLLQDDQLNKSSNQGGIENRDL